MNSILSRHKAGSPLGKRKKSPERVRESHAIRVDSDRVEEYRA